MVLYLRVSAVLVGAWLGVAPTAWADAITVVDEGQAAIAVAPWQPPISLSVRGTCASPRTLDEARGGLSSCPAGTWPAPGADWAPTVEVASGDTLTFRFPFSPTSVSVTGTTNYPVGLTTPDGAPVQNDSLGDFLATTSGSADASSWSVTVPQLDVRSTSEATTAIAVTAVGPGGIAANAAFRIQTPRFAAAGRCGTAFFSASQNSTQCGGQGIKGAPPGSPIPGTGGIAPGPAASVPGVRSARLATGCRQVVASVRSADADPLAVSVVVRGTTRASWERVVSSGRWTTVHLAVSAAVSRRLAASRSRPTLRVTTAAGTATVRLDRRRCR